MTFDVAAVDSKLPGSDNILTRDAIAFLSILHRTFDATRRELLRGRGESQRKLDSGELLDFPAETQHIRENDVWKGAPPAPGLVDRRVEITGPTDRKMVVNALNSNVSTYMADLEGKSVSVPLTELCMMLGIVTQADYTILCILQRFLVSFLA